MRRVVLLLALILVMSVVSLETAPAGAGDNDEAWSASIPLDSTAPHHTEYLDRLRRAITEEWSFPCVDNEETRRCEYKTTKLVVEFGVRKDGTVAFVNVLESSGYQNYDNYAVNAVKRAAPFPPIPDWFSTKGVPIRATFNYINASDPANIPAEK